MTFTIECENIFTIPPDPDRAFFSALKQPSGLPSRTSHGFLAFLRGLPFRFCGWEHNRVPRQPRRKIFEMGNRSQLQILLATSPPHPETQPIEPNMRQTTFTALWASSAQADPSPRD